MRTIRVWAILAGLLLVGGAAGAGIDADETVVFFPTAAHRSGDGWQAPLHGQVLEPEEGSVIRAGLLRLFRGWFGRDWTDQQAAVFRERARLFVMDAESLEAVSVRLAGRTVSLGRTGLDGHAEARVELPADPGPLATVGGTPGWLGFRAELAAGDARVFEGRVQLVPPTGVSVVSDLDDTVKITGVTDRHELLANTFLRPFRPVPGMAKLYRGWARQGAAFHYVSGSPWQLFAPLAAFLDREGFPAGSTHLARYRVSDGSVVELMGSPAGVKRPVIEGLLAAFPGRRFVLVGDAGQSDPELYGDLARAHPDQVAGIWIRSLDGTGRADARFQQAFRGVAPARWEVFEAASRVEPRLPPPTLPPDHRRHP